MFSIFKKKEQKYIEPSKLIAYAKIRKVLESCETIQQLSHTRRWMAELYNMYNWERDIYYHHSREIYETKWDEICEKLIVEGEYVLDEE